MAAMLRVARQQYASEQTLKLGFDRFWVLLRYVILESCLYTLAGLAAFWIAVQVYLLTPLSRSAMSMVTPEMADPNVIMQMLQDPVFSVQVTSAMLPLLLMFGVLYAVLFIPIS